MWGKIIIPIMITQLIWTIWVPMSSVPKKASLSRSIDRSIDRSRSIDLDLDLDSSPSPAMAVIAWYAASTLDSVWVFFMFIWQFHQGLFGFFPFLMLYGIFRQPPPHPCRMLSLIGIFLVGPTFVWIVAVRFSLSFFIIVHIWEFIPL